MTGSPSRPVPGEVTRTLMTAHFEVVSDATDTIADDDERARAAARVPALVMQALTSWPQWADAMGIQLSGHQYQLWHGDPPDAYSGMSRLYARELNTSDLLRGWVDDVGLSWYEPAELITAVFGVQDAYLTVRTSVGRVLILDSWALVAVQPGPAHRGARP